MKITFKSQAAKFLTDAATRKRNPLRPASVRTYTAIINQLTPLIGNVSLQDIGNKVVGKVVTELSEQGYSARAIALSVTLMKMVRKSAITPNGDLLFPYEWSSRVVDAPSVTSSDRTVTREAVQEALQQANDHDKALYAVLAGTGLRIAEARGIQLIENNQVNTIWLPNESKIVVRQQMTRTGLGPTKTEAGAREVDLAPELNNFLISFVDTFNGFMFPGKDSGYAGRLKKNGILGGFHAFRRFRITHLNRMSTPTGLEYFWTGHAAGDVHGRYVRFGSEIETRKTEAARVGLGFELPETV